MTQYFRFSGRRGPPCLSALQIIEAGGLDGRFFAHMEEIDLCWRLRSRGREIVCIPQSTVYHVGGATLKKENPRKTFLNFRNNLVMLYKNLPDEELNEELRKKYRNFKMPINADY